MTARSPCPFCGSTSSELHDDASTEIAFVFCKDCHASGPSFTDERIDYDVAVRHAVEGWNQRKITPSP